MDLLWPHLAPSAAGANLRKALHFARTALGSSESIAWAGSVLKLIDTGGEVDVDRFTGKASQAVQAQDPVLAEEALRLYRGELLPDDRYEPWLEEPRRRLRELHVRLLKLAGHYEMALQIDPTDEESHRSLIRAHFEANRRREAIRQFEQLREALREFVGVGPDEQTIALYEQVLALEGETPPTPAEQAATLVSTGLVHLNRQDFGRAEQLARQALTLAVEHDLGHEVGEATTLLALAANWTGRWGELFKEQFQSSFGRSAPHRLSVSDAHLCFVEYHVTGDSPGRVEVTARELIALAAEADSDWGMGLARLMLGEALLLQGDYTQARQEIEEAEMLNRQAGAWAAACLALEKLAEVALANGDRSRAQAILAGAWPEAGISTLRSHLEVRNLGVQIAAAPDTADAARRAADAEGYLARATRVCEPCSMNFHTQAALAYSGVGSMGNAHRHLADLERISGLWRGGPWHGFVFETRARLRLAEGHTDQAVALFSEAAQIFAESGRLVDEKRCRQTLGA